MLKKISHVAEAGLVKALYGFFYILPLGVASAIGGLIGRAIGPRLGVNRVSRKNIRNVFPGISNGEMNKIITGMWDNLGRVVAEFPHISKMKSCKFNEIVEVEGIERLNDSINGDKCTIFFSCHMANWELVPKLVFENGCKTAQVVYRKSNNPYLDKLILDVRNKYQGKAIPKGAVGARHLIKAIKAHAPIGMLVDQKQNDGIEVPFFGRGAMTAPAIATLALKYDCSIVPIQVLRKKGARFKIKIFDPLEIKKTKHNDKDVLKIMSEINTVLEGWISENPSQWFWVHNRWPKS